MRNLINLRHLNNSNVPSLEEMPPQLSQLTNLQALPNLVVGKDSESMVTEIGDPLFTIVVLVRLENCSKMSGVESVGLEFYGGGSLSFPLLETLEFEDMQHWKEWYSCEGDEGIRVFLHLKTLSINRCPRLEGKLPENLDSLTNLMVHDCDQLVKELLAGNVTSSWPSEDRLLPYLISLRSLLIQSNSQILQLHHLTSLQSLHIYKCPSLLYIPEASFPPYVEEIKIELCISMMYFARSHLPTRASYPDHGNTRFEAIIIERCANLKSLPEGLCHLANLRYLLVDYCTSHVSFPRGGLPTRSSNLTFISIAGCDKLKALPKGMDKDNLNSLQTLTKGMCV
ncbi:hypothetical protein PRUPE_2G030200 [Prunus persica]|uniref:NB-ARC domain-containing protein n=1 Tax=Prunus persica TaxID=3760 RepID=M5X5J9_PRUPE|nr:hypothetical protein PRUPE_2G030200 [Prunus persica]